MDRSICYSYVSRERLRWWRPWVQRAYWPPVEDDLRYLMHIGLFRTEDQRLLAEGVPRAINIQLISEPTDTVTPLERPKS